MSLNDFYVYEHVRSDTGAVFYVGKGRGQRAWRLDGRNPHHTNVRQKVMSQSGEVRIDVVATKLSEALAFRLEKMRIRYWQECGFSLANKTEGGEGASGMDEESRRRISEAKTGIPLSAEHRAKLSRAHKGRKLTPEQCATRSEQSRGRRHSEDTKRRISEAHRGRKRPPEHVEKSAAALRGRKLSEAHKSALSEARKGKTKTAEHRARIAASQPNQRPVICLDTGSVYRSAAEAAKATGAGRPNITKVCQGLRPAANGLRFEYAV